MAVEVRVPVLGESVSEATVGTWRKREGEQVAAGEALVELETDKVNVEVAAEQAGVLEQIAHQEGETVRPGEVLALLADGAAGGQVQATQAGGEEPSAAQAPETGGEKPSAAQAPEAGGEEPSADQAPEAGAADRAPGRAPVAGGDGSASAPAADRPHASPLARRIANEHGVELSEVAGSGAGGRVMREDVERHVGQRPDASSPTAAAAPAAAERATPPRAAVEPAAPAPEAPAAPSPQPPGPAAAAGRPEQRVRMSRRRRTIAQRLVEVQRTAAMLTTFNDVDMTAVLELRAHRKEAFRQRHGVNLGFMSFFTKAVVGALKALPYLNAEIQGDEVILKHYYDIGIAVAADEGLVVPVVRDADRKGFAEIEREIAGFAERAAANTLTLDDLRGGTFTITNGGVFGSLLSTPILSPPQVGILGMHRIEERPVVRDSQVVIRPMMYLALSYDHRIVDGREAVQFLVRVKELVEDPQALLLDG